MNNNKLEMQSEKIGISTSKTEISSTRVESSSHETTETRNETKETISCKINDYHTKQYSKDNVFRKIINKEIHPSIVLEDEKCLAFKDINPQASTHVIVIPKLECVDFGDFVIKSDGNVGYFFDFILKVVEELKIKSYRLVANTGEGAGQSVFHFHMHILSGELTHNLG